MVIDCETTGLSKNKDVFWQLSVMKRINGKTSLDNIFISPRVPISKGSENVTGVSTEKARELADFKTYHDRKEDILSLVNQFNNCTIIGHNISFDIGMITSTLGKDMPMLYGKRVDTMNLYKDVLKIKVGNSYKKPNLGEVKEFIEHKTGINLFEKYKEYTGISSQLHDARFDVFVTYIAYLVYEYVNK